MVKTSKSFTLPLFEADPTIYSSIQSELKRQQSQIELIASEKIDFWAMS